MAPISEDECPVCLTDLLLVGDGSSDSRESHIAACIESRLTNPSSIPALAQNPSKMAQPHGLPSQDTEADTCPICHMSFLTPEFKHNDSAREAHFSTCFESQASDPQRSAFEPVGLPPAYHRAATFGSPNMSPIHEKGKLVKSPPINANTSSGYGLARSNTTPVQTDRKYCLLFN